MNLTWYLKTILKIALNTVCPYQKRGVVYYNQYSLRYFLKPYGREYLGIVGCGPCVCAIAASSLLHEKIKPDQTAKWAFENGYYEYQHGSLHSLIPDFCQMKGLTCTDLGNRLDDLTALLKEKEALGILLCRAKTFAGGRHFVVVGLEGTSFRVYNSCNVFDCYKKFDTETLQNALASDNIYIGPVWCISKE